MLRRPWDVLRISDVRGQPQFSVTLNPVEKLVEFMLPDLAGGTQQVDFAGLKVSSSGAEGWVLLQWVAEMLRELSAETT